MHYNTSRVAKSHGSCQTLMQLASYYHKTQNAFLNIMIGIIRRENYPLQNLILHYSTLSYCFALWIF